VKMTRRRSKRVRATGPATAVRAAAPRRELVGLSARSSGAASAAATAAALGMSAAGLAPAASAAAAAAVMGAAGLKMGGHTIGEWISLRRNNAALPEQAALFSRDGVGIVFDGRTASVVVEISPRPWQLTTITSSGASDSPSISVDQLRRQLTQYDIRCSRLTAVCAGFKFASRDNAAGVLDTLIGPVSAPLGGTTAVVVSVDLDSETMVSAYRRAPRDRRTRDLSLPGGLCRMVTVAARRVSNALAEDGFGSELMGPHRLRAFHNAALVQLAGPLADPRWSTCGSPDGAHVRTFTPARGHWNARAAGSWHHLPSHRQYTSVTLTPAGDGGQALVQPLITYLASGGDALATAKGYGLDPAAGQQAAAAVQALPISSKVALRTRGAIIDDTHHLGFGIPAGGAGMFVGTRTDKTRVFVAATPSDEPLWLVGPKVFAMQMVARLATQDLRIAVEVDDPAWSRLVHHRNTPVLTFKTAGSSPAEVVVTTPQWWERNRELCSGKAVILVAAGDPGEVAVNRLMVVTADDGTAHVSVTVDSQSTVVGWELTPLERRTLLGEVDVEGAYPQESAELRLAERAQLPVQARPPKPAPAPPPPLADLPLAPPVSSRRMSNPIREPVTAAEIRYVEADDTYEPAPAPLRYAARADLSAPAHRQQPEPVEVFRFETDVADTPPSAPPPLRLARRARLDQVGRHRRRHTETGEVGDAGSGEG
jgi:type VII secretion protein EccE